MEDVPVFSRGPLRSRPFRCGQGGETLSMVGDASYQIVFVSLVLSISRSPAALAAVLVATALPRGGVLLLIGAQPRTSSHPAQSGLLAYLAPGGRRFARRPRGPGRLGRPAGATHDRWPLHGARGSRFTASTRSHKPAVQLACNDRRLPSRRWSPVRPGMASTGPTGRPHLQSERAPHIEVANRSRRRPPRRARARPESAVTRPGSSLVAILATSIANWRGVSRSCSALETVWRTAASDWPISRPRSTLRPQKPRSIPAQGVPTGNDGRSDLVE
jgi:hypothetical protein